MDFTQQTPFEVMGGEVGIRRLVDRFYDLMDPAPEAAAVRALHAASLEASREKLYLYLTMWTGGTPTYVEQRVPGELREFLRERLHALADHMRNQPQ